MNPDIVEYPLANPTLILSVSEDAFAPETGLQDGISLYIEKFSLKNQLVAENDFDENNSSTATFKLYTHEIDVPEESSDPVSLGLVGKDGTMDHLKGASGGNIDLYVESFSPDSVKKIQINVSGGHGWDGIATAEDKPPANGGDGGNGGHATVLLGRLLSQAIILSDSLLTKLNSDESQWPIDFRDTVRSWISTMDQEEVKEIYALPSSMKDAKLILSGSKDTFTSGVAKAYQKLLMNEDSLLSEVTNSINANGGTYGVGGTSAQGQGQSGKSGSNGSHQTFFIDSTSTVLNSTVCYLHPVECQMLLDKAKALLFLDNDDQKASALRYLQQLQQRFWFFGDPSCPDDLSDTNLGQAYRKAEESLMIVSGAKDEEPTSIQQLRSLYGQVDKTIKALVAPKDTYGDQNLKVPRGSFAFYKEYADRFLNDLQEIENAYLGYLNNDTDAEEQAQAVAKRGSLCDTSKDQIQNSIVAVKYDLIAIDSKIAVAQEDMRIAKVRLTEAIEEVEDAIASAFKFKFGDLLNGLSQIVSLKGDITSTVNIVNAGAKWAYDNATKISKDTGVGINKSYLVSAVTQIEGSIEDLHEGYTVLADGNAQFDDPGCEKLVLLETELNKLLADFGAALGVEDLHEVKEYFDQYIEKVQARNSAVMEYSADVQLLINYLETIEGLDTQKKDIVRDEYNVLGLGYPTLTAFMRTLYTNSLTTVQLWLKKMQQAYAFVALDETNIIGHALEGFKFSQFTYDMLNHVRSDLDSYYAQRVESWGQSMQSLKGVTYPIPNVKQDLQNLTSDNNTIQVVIKPDTINTNTKGLIFGEGRVDIRLMTIRCFIDGAKTDSGYLDLNLIHTGQEAIVDEVGTVHRFDHQPVVTNFRYVIETKDYTGPGTVDGIIGTASTDDQYAMVGPFTTWQIVINSANNPGLDLSEAKDPYLEFDIEFRNRP
ncbi:uncharacterized protein AKAW2_60338A [Aspergillus luchuensis]|uniref:Uncharacterized protein n=1 Tax=Aspergillus kawachii TaxID=1069201 RepID=A0A7R7X323_ASPKA|nr:uncharacterized protein AKAW2_60338A [Aspergillus luchuensis]BCS02074.1 hypothetical protein AKAW2_60338A [Aspergillus luchuensis]BCS13759.1 hypothetical protein ALUC_60315A [Aspergillus luchuensis]GAA90343.1 hypothetical protein AKAW_08457 [Aspergillus luchuensis IFO 4308]